MLAQFLFPFLSFFIFLTEKPSEPEAPLEVVDHTRNSLTLSWGASQSDGCSPILHYVLERREGWKTSWTSPIKVKPEGQRLSHCVQNLKEGQDYYFRVFAENTVGASRAIETETAHKPRSPFSEYGFVAPVNNSIPCEQSLMLFFLVMAGTSLTLLSALDVLHSVKSRTEFLTVIPQTVLLGESQIYYTQCIQKRVGLRSDVSPYESFYIKR